MPCAARLSGGSEDSPKALQMWNAARVTLHVSNTAPACEYHNLGRRFQAALITQWRASDWTVGIQPLSQIIDESQIIREYHQM